AFAFENLYCLGLFRGKAGVQLGLRRHGNFFTALNANAPDESLCADQVYGRRHKEWLNAHIHQTADSFRRAVRVQRGEHQVSGESGLNGDFGGFKVADFAHQNHVGVLPQKRAQRCVKVQADGFFHLHLVHAVQLELYRIFSGNNVSVRLVEQRYGRIKSVGFARSGGTGDQHHAIRLEHRALEFFQRLRLKTQLGHVEPQVFFIQQPHDHFLAPQRGQAVDAEVELLFLAANLHFQHDAPVLRQALFADIHLGHDLDARGDGVFQFHGRRHNVLQDAVNAEAHAVFFFVRLNVDVTGAALHCIRHYDIYQLYDGRFVG